MASKLFCPKCGDKNVIREKQSPNGGYLYVGEEIDNNTEVFDGDIEYNRCDTCNATFYLTI